MDRPTARLLSDTIETTIGELVEVITQIAMEAGKSEQEGYKLAALTIENILRRNNCEAAPVN